MAAHHGSTALLRQTSMGDGRQPCSGVLDITIDSQDIFLGLHS
jgi:hypothetical protein